MNDLISYQANSKSVFIAFLLSLIIPGAGHIYCGEWIFGLFVLIFGGIFTFLTFGLGALIVYPVALIGGCSAVNRYNNRLLRLKDV